MAGPYTFKVTRVAVKYPFGVQAEKDDQAALTAVELAADPTDGSIREGSLSMLVPGDERATFPEGGQVAVTLAAAAKREAAHAGVGDRDKDEGHGRGGHAGTSR